MAIESIFNKISNEEKRLRLFLEESLKNLRVGEKEMTCFYLGFLKIIEEQNKLIKQLHDEIEQRMVIQSEENELIRSLLGTNESKARAKASKFARHIVELKEKLYEKGQIEKRVQALEKEKDALLINIAEIKDISKKEFDNHFTEIEEEKLILQKALLTMGIQQEELSKELTAQKDMFRKEEKDMRREYFNEFIRETQKAKQQETKVVEELVIDFVVRMRHDLKNIVKLIDDSLDNLDLKKIGLVLPVEKVTPRNLGTYLKGLKQTLVFLNKLIHKQRSVAKDFIEIASVLKTLDKASLSYLDLIRPLQKNITEIPPHILEHKIENLFFTICDNKDIRLMFDIDKTLPELFFDENGFNIAVKELFVNACESIRGPGEVWVKLRYFEKTNNFVFQIGNNGKPISKDLKNRIFAPFITDKADRNGLGLTRAKIACQSLGGDLSLVKSDEDNTIFEIILPALIRNQQSPKILD
ncbi:MAG: ATP-binding protein [bacterium]